jgi:hypothetical protein
VRKYVLQGEELYRQAAAEEAAALDALKDDKHRTRGITAVSAVALWYKGRDYLAAEQLAHKYLSLNNRQAFAEAQLRELLSLVWTVSAAEKAGVRFVHGDILVSVKGGEVIHGGAPLDLIIRKVEGIQAVLFRTVEMLLGRPFRKRGGPPTDLISMFRPWLFQAPAGSYQFAVRMQEPEQRVLWEFDRPRIEHVTSTFFRVLSASASRPEVELAKVVPDEQYRRAFLGLSRNLAPAGKTFSRLEVRDASTPSEPLVTLVPETRQGLNSALRGLRPTAVEETITVRGNLRGLHLDRDWLEITRTDGVQETIHVEEAGEALDDVVGPMVNKKVMVTAVRRGSKYLYRDIELDE